MLRGDKAPAAKGHIVLNFVVMEETDGDLLSLRLQPRIVAKVMQALARRLACLWENDLVYTDMTPENIAYKSKGSKFRVSLILSVLCKRGGSRGGVL